MTSNVNDLSARLRDRVETERREMTAIAERELQTFGEKLSGSANKKLSTTVGAMEAQIGRMHGLLLRAWLRPLVIGLSLFLGILGGSWGLTQWQSTRVQRLVETQEALQREIAQAQTALAQLEAQTWGVWLHEAEDGTRYVVLPTGTLEVAEWPWTVQGQHAIRLSSE